MQETAEGRIWLEVEHARSVYNLALLKERAGDVQGAWDLVQNKQVETYGTLSLREKMLFILLQIK